MEILHKELTNQVIGAYYKVYNKLGYGFLEKVYENAMCIELNKSNIEYKKQHPIRVFYDEKNVGCYYADLFIEDILIVEIKAMVALREEHEYQLMNYLKATDVELGLLLNFGKKAEFRRKIFMNDRKKSA